MEGEKRKVEYVANSRSIPRDELFEALEKAGHIDLLLKDEKEWLLESILLAIKKNADRLIEYNIERKDDEVIVSASLGVVIRQDDGENK